MAYPRQKRVLYIVYILSFLSYSAGIFFSYAMGRLYPAIGIAMLVTSLLLLYPAILERETDYIGIQIGVAVIFAVAYRVYIYIFPPNLIGYDPNWYAQWTRGIVETGNFVGVITSGFYSEAPLVTVLPAQVSIITDTPSLISLGIYPLLIGLLIPLSAYLFARRIRNKLGVRDKQAIQAPIVGAIIASVATVTILLSYQPIAQTLGVLLWCTFLVAVLGFIRPDKRYLIVIGISFAAILLTHRLPPVYITAVFVIFPMFLIWSDKPTELPKGSKLSPPLASIIVLTLLFLLGTYLQSIKTDYISVFVWKSIHFLSPSARASTALYQAPTSFQFAIPVEDSLRNILLSRGHGFILILLSGLAWLIMLRERQSKAIKFVLSIAIVTTLFMALSLFNPVLGILTRHLFLGEPVLAVLTAVGFLSVLPSMSDSSKGLLKKIGVTLVVIIILAQIISVTVTLPDRPNSNRKYLTMEEAAGTEFACEYATGTVMTDRYYATTSPNSFIRKGKDLCLTAFGRPPFLFTSNLSTISENDVLIRSETEYSTSNGIYRIRWDPQKYMSIQSNRVYTSGSVVLFSQ